MSDTLHKSTVTIAPKKLHQLGLPILKRYTLAITLVLLVCVSQYLYSGFLTPSNIVNIFAQNAPLGIIAVGMTLVMITGGFDLSVGSVFAIGATLYTSLVVGGMGLLEAFLLTTLVGVAAGSLNGALVTRLDVNPFVATLGTMSVFTGAALIYSNSQPYMTSSASFTLLGRGSLAGLPYSIWILAAFMLAGQLILSLSVYGRQIYAVGGNTEAARLAGLRVAVVRGSTYAICSGCAAVAGMIMASRLDLGQADMGRNMALDSIAVVVIGGTSLSGGRGAVWQTAIGLMLVAVLTNLLDSLAVSANYQLLIKGTIVVAAVALDAISRRHT
ncbi:ABC transporter permease [Ruegeria sp. EL01]|jgi:ribose/xylose/arabinose/galactoside ABC-type transport system permease subunit|uniref:ABC transporter permease n=1 Tax=Ruegeria sp. EL01 TaxID=2107578 RepID=UPI000EA838DD|nr:ABC transporter permease [Ruegeria sp. EL01]